MMLQTETILMQSEQTFLAKTRDRSSWSRRSAKSVYLFCKKSENRERSDRLPLEIYGVYQLEL